jgi:hypothetical protein
MAHSTVDDTVPQEESSHRRDNASEYQLKTRSIGVNRSSRSNCWSGFPIKGGLMGACPHHKLGCFWEMFWDILESHSQTANLSPVRTSTIFGRHLAESPVVTVSLSARNSGKYFHTDFLRKFCPHHFWKQSGTMLLVG